MSMLIAVFNSLIIGIAAPITSTVPATALIDSTTGDPLIDSTTLDYLIES